LHNQWLTKYFLAPLYMIMYYREENNNNLANKTEQITLTSQAWEVSSGTQG